VLRVERSELACQLGEAIEIANRIGCDQQRFDDSMDGGGRPRRELAVETPLNGFHVSMFAHERVEQAGKGGLRRQQRKEVVLFIVVMV